LGCDYCQNWQFSQVGPEETRNFPLNPEAVVAKALDRGCSAMAYFYTEPTVYFEYMWDIAGAAKKAGLLNIMVTAGYINEEPLRELCTRIDAFTVGLKGFDEKFYRDTIHGSLAPVLRSIETIAASGRWFEVVTLIVPGRNSSPELIEAQALWMKEKLGAAVPLHFTRFRPQYKMRRLPLTPVRILEKAREVARAAGLEHVYIGNLPGHAGNHSYCTGCGATVVSRLGFEIVESSLERGRCKDCGCVLPGLWR
jgi:pyruvate formate lyase activating enzyme